MREIIQIKPQNIGKIKSKKKVCAYARVSMDTDRLRHSLSTQVSYYNKLIQNNPDWEFKGVYADLGISGTTKNRDEFNKMLDECNKGNIDIILTKSIQRFARNTVDLLEIVRELKFKGIEVRFEKENISSMSGDGELMLSILASFAQEESRQISENVKWGIRKRIEKGMLHAGGHFRIYGYRWDGDILVPDEEESKIVKRIFNSVLEGKGLTRVAKELNEEHIPTSFKAKWHDSTLYKMIRNNTYTGNMLFQKEFKTSPINGKRKVNHGEKPQYLIKNSHEAIISQEIFDKVQEEMKMRNELKGIWNPAIPTTVLTRKIRCVRCNRTFYASTRNQKSGKLKYWCCATRKEGKGNPCKTGDLNHEVLIQMIAEVLNKDKYSDELVEKYIDHIDVYGKEKLIFHLKDNSVIERKYELKSRKEHWTNEYREQYKNIKRNKHKAPIKNRATPYTGLIECDRCGNTFKSSKSTLKNGEEVTYLSCRTKRNVCPKNSIQLSNLKQLTCEVLKIEEFDEKIMDENIERIYISDNKVRFEFKNGDKIIKEYLEKKRGYQWTEERRKKQYNAYVRRKEAKENE